MSKFLVAPRPLEAMMTRPTVGDLAAHQTFSQVVDLSDLPYFDANDVYHLALADAISEGVYRHGLIEKELSAEHAILRTDPLLLAFQPGLARATVTMGPDGGRHAGQLLFDREAGGPPKVFRPGRWLIRFKEIQDREDEEVRKLTRKRQNVLNADVCYSAIDDSDIFKEAVLGFRQARNVHLP